MYFSNMVFPVKPIWQKFWPSTNISTNDNTALQSQLYNFLFYCLSGRLSTVAGIDEFFHLMKILKNVSTAIEYAN